MILTRIKRALMLLMLLPCLLGAQTFQKGEQGIKFASQGIDIQLEFYTPDIVRVYKTLQGEAYENKSLVVEQNKLAVKVDIEQNQNFVTLASTDLKIKVNLETGSIQFFKKDGETLLLDKDYGTRFSRIDDGGKLSYKVRTEFLLDKYEPIYGIGQIQDNTLNRRNSRHHLQNENMHTTSPFFMSIKGYGVYVDNYSISDFVDDRQGLSFECIGKCADYYFLFGKNADGVISKMRLLTGKVPMLPLWAYGFFQSKERYKTQEESVDVVKKLRALYNF